MNNEDEGRLNKGSWVYLLLFYFALVYLRFFIDTPESAKGGLNYCLIVLTIILPFGIYKEIMSTSSTKEEKVVLITPDHVRKIEQERVLKAEEARLKAREDEKKAERAKLARLLDEL